MTGLPELVAADRTETIGGVVYTFTQLTILDRAQIQQRILSKRGDPIETARRLAIDATPEERERIFDRAYRDEVKAKQLTAEEQDEFENSAEGAVFAYWLSLRKHHPDLTEDDAAQLLERQLTEAMRDVTEKIREQYPEANDTEVMQAVAGVEGGVLGELLKRIDGMPAGNSATPGRPGTPKNGQSPGSNGSSTPVENEDSPTDKSAT